MKKERTKEKGIVRGRGTFVLMVQLAGRQGEGKGGGGGIRSSSNRIHTNCLEGIPAINKTETW